jgi:hypothetical protein
LKSVDSDLLVVRSTTSRRAKRGPGVRAGPAWYILHTREVKL